MHMEGSALTAAAAYVRSRPATEPLALSEPPTDAATRRAADFTRAFLDTLGQGEALSQRAMLGDADPHALVTALAASELAVETVVAVRDRVVEAYQEILRMPV